MLWYASTAILGICWYLRISYELDMNNPKTARQCHGNGVHVCKEHIEASYSHRLDSMSCSKPNEVTFIFTLFQTHKWQSRRIKSEFCAKSKRSFLLCTFGKLMMARLKNSLNASKETFEQKVKGRFCCALLHSLKWTFWAKKYKVAFCVHFWEVGSA